MSRKPSLEAAIREELDAVGIIDTHEHLDTEDELARQSVDFGRLFLHYANCDLISAGCPAEDITTLIEDADIAPRDKWRLIAPYWEAIRDTGYARCLDVAVRELYDLDGLCAETVEPLSQAMAANRRPGFYREVFDRAGIQVALWNPLGRVAPLPHMWQPVYDRDLFIPDVLSQHLEVGDPSCLQGWDREIQCLDDYLAAIETRFAAYAPQASALKVGVAYSRPLSFSNPSRGEVEPIFNRLIEVAWAFNAPMPSMDELRRLQDYLLHHSLRLCQKHDLVCKFHTGLQEGNGNTIRNSRAALLANLFTRYPNVRFDVYHISYPYQEELLTLAKNFPNVAIDFCWMWIINPAAGRRALSDCLDAVPANKIHGFGGDFIFVEGSYGHAIMAKEQIARTLAGKVDDGDMSLARAQTVGRWLLHDNPKRWFRLEEKGLL